MVKLNLPVHNHPLLPSDKFCEDWCSGCRYYGYIYSSYRCNESGCDTIFHKECVESPLEINHTSHPNHSLKLTLDVKGHCGLCGGYYWKVCYYCSICDFGLHLGCGTRPQGPLTLHHSKAHEHELLLSNGHSRQPPCLLCDLPYSQTKNLYECSTCNMFFHMECVVPEIYHTSHTKHPLKLLRDGPPSYTNEKCTLCGVKLQKKVFHHCDICNFSVCKDCSMTPPPLEVLNLRTHEHKLHLVPREIIFTCDICGTLGEQSPYLCVQCNFMIHGACIDLPCVININRHDHRISYTPYLGSRSENLKCGVCRKKVSEFHGVYSCSKCPNYVVHLRCATRKEIWDKIELEGTIEDIEEIMPYQVIDNNTIKHFSHDHNLKFNKQDNKICKENVLCEACVMQIGSDPFYKCDECEYILHETCANLLRKKRHVCHNEPFTLQVSPKGFTTDAKCELCYHQFTGFRYQSGEHILDTRCGSITEPVISHHPHPLYYIKPLFTRCSICGLFNHHGMLSCDDCEFTLDFKCAFLPKKVMIYKYDDHPLLLSTGVDIEHWCEVCETKIDKMNWFYGCYEGCGVSLHVWCVIGDFTYHMPNRQITSKLGTYEVIFNISSSRPICYVCDSRCKLPFVLKFYKHGEDIYLCSIKCFLQSFMYG